MNKLKWSIIVLYCFLFTAFEVAGQDRTQTVRGTVVDKYSRLPLPGAAVVLLDTDPPVGVATDADGNFKIEDVPAGRIGLQVSYLGYQPVTLNNLELTTGKQLVLTIELEEMVIKADEVVVTAEQRKDKPLNDMAVVSARMFSVEETNRYAGSFNDPARMVSNFAGVNGSTDQRNDIIIRGNSPVGLLWRFEGVDIPSPNHFMSQGTNGGPVSILNNNLLANSDFMTGAFPAEYGNGLAGVFDLRMRKGNTEKRESTFQVGFNGAELLMEGPISRNRQSSYLGSYRYSTLDIFDALGINFGTAGIPRYQDLSLKVRLPSGKLGYIDVFGIGGISNISLLDSEREETDNTFGLQTGRDVVFGSDMGATGISQTLFWDDKTYHKLIIAVSGSRRKAEVDSILPAGAGTIRVYNEGSASWKQTFSYVINRKFSAKHNLKAGFIADKQGYDLDENVLDQGSFRDLRQFSGTTYLFRTYAQWRYKPSNVFVVTSGLHFQRLTLNNSHSVEPRLGFKWQLREKQSLSMGYGLHSQLQLPEVYFYKTVLPGSKSMLTNTGLGMNKSHQVVLGYDLLPGKHLRIKIETYYQYLFNIPVETASSSFSVLNLGSDFIGIPELDSLVNNGTGENYGIEFTLERFFGKGYYYLATLSLYESHYTGSDGIQRNTTYNGNFVANALAGKEFRIGKNNLLSVDGKVTYAGGKRYTPLDLQRSYQAQAAVYNEGEAFSKQFKHYFRVDINLGFRVNGKKVTQEWAFDVQNVLNTQNILLLNYDAATNSERPEYQLGIFPVFQYRVMF